MTQDETIEYISRLKTNISVAKNYYKLEESLKNNEEFMLKLLSKLNITISYNMADDIEKRYPNNEEIEYNLFILGRGSREYCLFSEKYRLITKCALMALDRNDWQDWEIKDGNGNNKCCIPNALLEDKEFVKKAMDIDPEIYKYVSKEIKDGLVNDKIDMEKESTLFDISESNHNKAKICASPPNQILYGPPGTGKTYNTINKALEIIDGKVSSDRSEAKKRFEELKSSGQIEFVTFHQSYGYEEFVEGIKAKTTDRGIEYQIEDGIFKKVSKIALRNIEQSKENAVVKKDFTVVFKEKILDNLIDNDKLEIKMKKSSFYIKEVDETHISFDKSGGDSQHVLLIKNLKAMYEAGKNEIILGGLSQYYNPLLEYLLEDNEIKNNEKQPLKNYILIIDEINRGNISKIFGELITLIEPSKRIGADEEIRVKLPYSGDEFGVPSNLCIIGTMNTADRSIALMDTALRRRFEFVEMMPKAQLLDFEVVGVNIKLLLQTINKRVEYLYDRDHTIGHAYFIDIKTKDDLDSVMRNKIIPLLQEYFYDDWEKILMVLGDGFVEKIEVKNDIFDYKVDDYLEETKFCYTVKNEFDYSKFKGA